MNTRKKTTRLAVGAALVGAALAASGPASACRQNSFIGEICVVAGSYCPDHTLEAQGQLVLIDDYQALFALIGQRYGGSGTVSFALPDLRGRAPVGIGTGPGLDNVLWGEYRGYDQLWFSEVNLPAHTHLAAFNSTLFQPPTVEVPVSKNTATTQSAPDATHNYLAGAPPSGVTQAKIWSSTPDVVTTVGGVTVDATGASGEVTINAAGNGQPFHTDPPELGVRYCIVAEGYFPPRPSN